MTSDVIAPPPVADEQRLLLPRVSWDFYRSMREELDRTGNGGVRLTFDRGALEIMVTGRLHEWSKKMLGKLVETLVYERHVPVCSGGSMTFQREDLLQGLEADDCWWIAHEPLLRGRQDYDPHTDPPPDLAVEVEITRPLLGKLGVYAALGVPEIWRFNGQTLRFWHRQADETYQPVEASVAFPFLRPEHLLPYLQIDDPTDETTRLHQFAEWLRGVAEDTSD
jgi:Uma2 family endonuclease